MKSLFSLAALLIASTAQAHGIAVVRSQVVVPYTPVVQVQSACAVQAFAAPCHVQQVQAVQVQQVVAQPVVVQQVIRQQVVHPVAVRQQVIQVRQQRQQVIQRSVTRSRTVIR